MQADQPLLDALWLSLRELAITETKTVRHLAEYVHITGQLQIAGHDITALRLEAQHFLRVLPRCQYRYPHTA